MNGSRAACIDIGSNTVKLTVVERDDAGCLSQLWDGSVTTRLGENMAGRRLREAAMRRTLDELRACLSTCRRLCASPVRAVGTSALRDAENRDEFVSRANDLGINVTPISGEEEARLTFVSVRCDPIWDSASRICVIDIGGGSTELITGSHCGDSGISLPLGAVRLTERHLHSDPPTVRQIAEASRAAADSLDAIRPLEASCLLVGVGGTFVNMAAVKLGLAEHRPDMLHGACLTEEDIEDQLALYAAMGVAQRRRIIGLEPERADVILSGAIILSQALSRLGRDRMSVSCRGLRWGVLYEELGVCGA